MNRTIEDIQKDIELLGIKGGYDIEQLLTPQDCRRLSYEIERLNNIINELDKQNGELGADLSIIKDRIIKTNWWLEKMLKQATNKETKAIINGTLDLLLGSDKE